MNVEQFMNSTVRDVRVRLLDNLSHIPGSHPSEFSESSVESSVRTLKEASDVPPGWVLIMPRNRVTLHDRT